MNKVSALALKQIKDLSSEVSHNICITKHTVDAANKKRREYQMILNTLIGCISNASEPSIDKKLQENIVTTLNDLVKELEIPASEMRKASENLETASSKMGQCSTWLSAVMDDNI